MVSILSIIFMFITLILCFGVPILLVILFIKKKVSTLKVFLIGVLGFLVMQILIRIPLLSLLATQSWYVAFSSNIIGIAIFLGLTAALFESFGRLFVFKLLLKKNRTYGDGLMAGLGHGAIEAIVLVGLAYINNIVLSVMINTGSIQTVIDGLVATPAAATQTKAVIDTLISTPAPTFLLGGVERVLTIIINMALSLLVLEGIRRKQTTKFMIFAILAHATLDFLAVYLLLNGVNILLIELVVVAFSALSLFYIFTAKKRFSKLVEDQLDSDPRSESVVEIKD